MLIRAFIHSIPLCESVTKEGEAYHVEIERLSSGKQ